MEVYFQFYETTHDGWLAERIDFDEATLIVENDQNMDQYVCLSDVELEWNKLYDLENETDLDKFKPWEIHRVKVMIDNKKLKIRLISKPVK
jgi:hypothetical protein